MSGWSLVVTVPHRERSVARMLTAFDVPFHFFRELRQQVWRGRVIERPYPIFPGYVFAIAHGAWDRVRSISGVLGFVRLGDHVSTVDDRIVEELVRASVDDVLPARVPVLVSRFNHGDRVRVQGANVLAGQVGIFQRMLIGTQAIIELDWMGRWVPIPIDERDLEMDIARRKRRRARSHRRNDERNWTSNSAVALSLV